MRQVSVLRNSLFYCVLLGIHVESRSWSDQFNDGEETIQTAQNYAGLGAIEIFKVIEPCCLTFTILI